MRSAVRILAAVLAAAAALPARAAARAGDLDFLPPRNEISDEVAAGNSPPTSTSQRSTQVGNTLEALLDVGAGFSLDLSFAATVLRPAQAVPGMEFATRGTTVYDLGAGVVWEASDHVTAGVVAHLSPTADLWADSAVTVGTSTLDALVESRSSSVGGGLRLGYDTAGGSDLEAAVDLGANVEHYATDQRLRAVREPGGTVLTPADIRTRCRVAVRCNPMLLGLLRETPAELTQVSLQAAFTGTLWRNTDLGIGGAWYGYDVDPTRVGYFHLAAPVPVEGSLGGVALAPLSWSVRPLVVHRAGDWTLRLAYEHGSYVSGEGALDTVSFKVQYRVTTAFRLWGTAARQRDRDGEGNVIAFGTVSLGALYRW